MNHPKHIVAVSGLISHPNGRILLIRVHAVGGNFRGVKSKKVKTLLRHSDAKFKKRLASPPQLDRWSVFTQISSHLQNWRLVS